MSSAAAPVAPLPRSVRNNNPGNIRRSETLWRGTAGEAQLTEAQRGETEFVVFVDPRWGFRALARTLLTYQQAHGCATIEQFVSRWAPPSENDTGAYIRAVAGDMKGAPSTKLELRSAPVLELLCKAIATHEAGGWDGLWHWADLETGVAWAFGRGM